MIADTTTPRAGIPSRYTDAIDALHFSDSDKKELVERILSSGGRATSATTHASFKPRKTRNFLTAAAAALAAVLIIGGSVAYATGGLVPLHQALERLFPGSSAQTETIDTISQSLDAASSDNGITVSAEAIIGDASNCLVVFDIVREDGEIFDTSQTMDEGGALPYFFDSSQTSVIDPSQADESATRGHHNGTYFFDANPDDSSIQMVRYEEFDASESIIGKTMQIDLHDLVFSPGDGHQRQVIEGNWHLEFGLNYKDSSVVFPASATLDAKGMTGTIDSIRVSPIAFHIRYTVDLSQAFPEFNNGDISRELDDEDFAAANACFEIGTVSFHKADGTTIDFTTDDPMTTDNANGMTTCRALYDGPVAHCEIGSFFNPIINTDDIVAITIGDTMIER